MMTHMHHFLLLSDLRSKAAGAARTKGTSIMIRAFRRAVARLSSDVARWCVLWGFLSIVLQAAALAQSHRSAWMWSTSSHPYGAVNVLGNEAKEHEVISNFGYWGFDRIYTSVGDMPINSPNAIAFWNAALGDANVQSQSLYGLIYYSPSQMANLVQTKLINFNNSRTNPNERFDAVHLDLEPQGTSEWQSATATDKHNMLLNLRDTYAATRAQLDNNGCADVKIYADLPVWFDSLTSNLGWANQADRNQWFADIALSLDGISLMAYERSTLSSIVSGVGWEVANFNGEVRIGLNVAEVGPGKTFANFDALMGMAESLESYYGSSIGGIDFHALTSFSDLMPARPPGDYNGDGTVDAADYAVWRKNLGSMTHLNADGDFSGTVAPPDYQLWRANYGLNGGSGSVASPSVAIPEPASCLLCAASFVTMFVGMRRRR